MKIGIIGAGISGLTLAHVLEKLNISYQLFEGHHQLSKQNHGMTLAHNGCQIFQVLKLSELLNEQGQKISSQEYTDERFKTLLKFDLNKFDLELKSSMYGIHQTELLQSLLDKLPAEKIHFSHKVVNISQRLDKTLVRFENDVSQDFDLVVGADGVHSTIRKLIFPYLTMDYTGQTSWRFVIDHHFYQAPRDQYLEVWGKGNRFGIMGIGKGRWSWFVMANSLPGQTENHEELRQSLLQLFSSFHPSITKLIQHSPFNQMTKQDLFELPLLDQWGSGRVILIGDAAHVMPPSLAQGGNQGIEDAWFLGESLVRSKNIEAALKTFVQERRKRIQLVLTVASMLNEVGHFHGNALKNFRNKTMRMVPQFVFDQMMKKFLKVKIEIAD